MDQVNQSLASRSDRSRRSTDELRVPATTSSLATVRAWLRARLDRVRWIESRRHDVELVASELSANAVEHGDGSDVAVRVDHDDDALDVTVESDGDFNVDTRGHEFPSLLSPSGRGLALTRRVADWVAGGTDGLRSWVTARFERASSPHH